MTVPIRSEGDEFVVGGDPAVRVLASPGLRSAQRNPYVKLLYGALVELGVQVDDLADMARRSSSYDVFHVHWPEFSLNTRNPAKAALRSRNSLRRIDELRSEGVKVVWTIHNLHSHERFHPRLEPRFWRAFTGRVDGLIAMSDYGLAAARSSFPALGDVPGFVVPHGHYRDSYQTTDPASARRALQIPERATVVAFVGSIRRYKGIDRLVEAFRQIDSREIFLLVAGRPNLPALRHAIEARRAGDDRIKLCLRELTPVEVSLYLSAADLIVLPYVEVLNSGTALLALSFAKPILVPALGTLPELQAEFGEGLVRVYDGEIDPEIVRRALEWARQPRGALAPSMEHRSWSRVAALTLSAYQQVLGRAIAA